MKFKNVNNVETIEGVPEGATVLGLVDGELMQMPSAGLGGGKQLVITMPVSGTVDYYNPDFANATANMTLDEAFDLLTASKFTGGMIFSTLNGVVVTSELIGRIRNESSGQGAKSLFISMKN